MLEVIETFKDPSGAIHFVGDKVEATDWTDLALEKGYIVEIKRPKAKTKAKAKETE